MPRLVYTCPFVPHEWIAAHGIQPARILPVEAGDAGEGVCPYAWAFARAVLAEPSAAGVIVTTACDQMRRVAERIERDSHRPVFLLHVPTTWETPAARGYYVEELRRLSRFMTRLGGVPPSRERLITAAREADTCRAALRAARPQLSPRRFAEGLLAFHTSGKPELTADSGTGFSGPVVSLALVGGPMLLSHFDLYDFIAHSGGRVVLDGTESGERGMPAPLDSAILERDPLRAIAEAHFLHIPDAFRRPDSRLHVWLRREVAARGIRGVILRYYTWCDTWHAEVQRMKETLPVPVLALSTDGTPGLDAHSRSRVEAFLEMLR